MATNATAIAIFHAPIVDADADLIQSARSGDAAAFTELVTRHYQSSLKLARSILRDFEDAEDEVQNAFTKVYLHLSRFEGNSRFSTWLSRIVVNQCLMRLRKARRARFAYLDDPGSEEGSVRLELADPAANPEQSLGRAQVEAILRREVNCIPPLLREPLLLRESMRMPLSDVAEKLNITEAAAKSRLLRARRELKTRLIRHQGIRGPATLIA
ncbi:MAG: sigma-70 family RNA polymerase sigma factor [Bryobacteraceae bacterium]